MTLPCEYWQSAAEPAAQMTTFEYEGQVLHCLVFVSSCMICGHRWDDKRYEAVNAQYVEQARAALTIRRQSSHETHVHSVFVTQSVVALQSP